MADQIFDGPGIDTKRERDAINYRPSIEYQTPEINASYYAAPSNPSEEVQSLFAVQITDVWNRAKDIIQSLETTKEKFEEKLKDGYAVIPSELVDLAKEAAKQFGYDITDDRLPFDLYKDILQAEPSMNRDLLESIFEDYYSDVYGNIHGELYPDLINIQEDWKKILDFINKGIVLQIADQDKLIPVDADDEKALSLVQGLEAALTQRYLNTKQAYEDSETNLRKLYITSSDTPEYFAALQQYQDSFGSYRDVERRVFTKKEVTDLVEYKTNNAEPLVTSLGNLVDYEAYGSSIEGTLSQLLHKYTGQSAENGLRKVQAMLKLSIDGKINTVNNLKNDLRVIGSNTTKENINSSLVKGVHMRNEIFGSVYDLMDDMELKENDEVFDSFADYIADSVVQSDSMYKDQALDFQKVHSLDNELYVGKLGLVLDKDGARQLYIILDSLIVYAKEKGWPSSNSVSSWLQGFMNHQGLK